MPKLWGREPALWISTASAILSVLVGFGLPGLTDGLAAALTAFLTAAAAAWTAWHVRPVAPSVFTGVVTTGATLLTAFGLDLTQQQVALVAVAVTTVMTLIVRAQVSPAMDQRPNRVT